MATKAQLEKALLKAHEQGNTEHAKIIASALRETGSDFSFGEMVSNVPSSAKQFAENVAQPFIHPIDTIEGLTNLGAGLVDKGKKALTRELHNSIIDTTNFLSDMGAPYEKINPQKADEAVAKLNLPNEKYADSVGQMYKDRYGSLDSIKQTAMNDPVGMLADTSMAITGTGGLLSAIPGASKLGGVMQKTGMALEPINMAKGAAKAGLSKMIPKNMPHDLYLSSAKFSNQKYAPAERYAMADTALKHGILPTGKGVDKLTAMVSDFSNQIDGLITEATQSGKLIPKKAVFSYLKDARKKMGGAQVRGKKNLSQIDNVAKEINIQLKDIDGDFLNPNQLQALKKSAYDEINFDTRNFKGGRGTEAAMKSVGRKSKELIEETAEVKGLNRDLGDLLQLREPLAKSMGRIENRDLIGIGTPIKIGAGTALGGDVGGAMATALSLFENPKLKARMAVGAKNLQNKGMFGAAVDNDLLSTLLHYGLLNAGRLPPTDKK